ncbi:MAG: Pyrophosphate--fructose 6-phosphate 1-phosphotransferase, alpha subunit [Polyangiaceae bacterium]|jgi:6-phosphofructokinase 1|nr:Pyrophosphate--fructose 6-phosphate 1-phosphotransferase, alpha subunit [Polyangiaceae bacterium]
MGSTFDILRLGPAKVPSPLRLRTASAEGEADQPVNYVRDDERVLYRIELTGPEQSLSSAELGELEKAGPREKLFFAPGRVHAAIVTCGGLCPGLNDVIRSIVMTLWNQYGVRRISGIRYGYRGLLPGAPWEPMQLEPSVVARIHRQGGTILGGARGGGSRTGEIVDTLQRLGVDMLFTIGGDGTQKGAAKIADEINARGLPIAVVGVPKTIDNDLSFVEKSFGFETAVTEGLRAVEGAHTEAEDAINGVGLVKLMGRESGFIAAHAALASNDADFVLVPEVPFDLEGPNGFLSHLQRCVQKNGHALVVVAEGAGQKYVEDQGEDAGGNRILGDIGVLLRKKILAHFGAGGIEIAMKYIDPSYMIRSMPACASDSIYCARLGSNAVHAAMTGRTACLVGRVNNRLVHVPIGAAADRRNRVDPEGALWRDVVNDTGQPLVMTNP